MIHANDDEALRESAYNGRFVSSKSRHFEIVKYLVEHRANIHARNDDALRNSAKYGYLEVVKYLVKNGADIYAINK